MHSCRAVLASPPSCSLPLAASPAHPLLQPLRRSTAQRYRNGFPPTTAASTYSYDNNSEFRNQKMYVLVLVVMSKIMSHHSITYLDDAVPLVAGRAITIEPATPRAIRSGSVATVPPKQSALHHASAHVVTPTEHQLAATRAAYRIAKGAPSAFEIRSGALSMYVGSIWVGTGGHPKFGLCCGMRYAARGDGVAAVRVRVASSER